MGKKRSDDGKIPRITKTCKVLLDGKGVRIPIGDFTLTEKEPGPTIEQFADAAYKAARASLARLMVPEYRLIVVDGAIESGWGLSHWIKLVDGVKEEARRQEGKGAKQTIHKKAAA